MKALGLVVSDKKILENCILKTYFLTPWLTYATNLNGLNKFDSRPPRDHACDVWSKSNMRFQMRCCLKKLLTHGRTMDDGQWAITKAHLEHFVVRWAKKAWVSTNETMHKCKYTCKVSEVLNAWQMATKKLHTLLKQVPSEINNE